jgi:uncharacterized protein (DUF302 family)
VRYYFTKVLDGPFDNVLAKVEEALAGEGFGILTRIDVKATLKKKLNVNFPEYRILGACNPPFAHRALMAEPRIGLMLPCNVIVREGESGGVEVAAIDPVASMAAVENRDLESIGKEVQEKLKAVIQGL